MIGSRAERLFFFFFCFCLLNDHAFEQHWNFWGVEWVFKGIKESGMAFLGLS